MMLFCVVCTSPAAVHQGSDDGTAFVEFILQLRLERTSGNLGTSAVPCAKASICRSFRAQIFHFLNSKLRDHEDQNPSSIGFAESNSSRGV